MQRREYRTTDKSDWPDGLWQYEPDKVQWQDETTGLPCLIVRNHGGALCGYVGVPPGHRYHGADYDGVDVDVHGGLTYADACQSGPEESAICHVPDDGEPDNVWWLGFDCAHAGDLCPKYERLLGRETYRPLSYVESEVASLARQLAGS